MKGTKLELKYQATFGNEFQADIKVKLFSIMTQANDENVIFL